MPFFLALPYYPKIVNFPEAVHFEGCGTTGLFIGCVLSSVFILMLYIGAFLLFFWFTWGVFQYIFAGGDKNGLAKARSRIQWAIIGFLILILSFSVSFYVREVILPPQLSRPNVPNPNLPAGWTGIQGVSPPPTLKPSP